MLRGAALRLIGSLTLSDQLCGCVGVVLTGRVEGTDFRLRKGVWKVEERRGEKMEKKKIGGGGVGRVERVGAPPRNNHPIPQALLCVNMPTSFEKLRRREKPRRGGGATRARRAAAL